MSSNRDLKAHLDKLEQLCTDSSSLSTAKDAIDKALTDHGVRLKIFMAAVSSRKIQSVVRMMNFLDTVEERLLDPDRWQDADNATLLKVFNALNLRIDNDMDMFQKILGEQEIDISKILLAMNAAPQTDVEKHEGILSRESRDKVRNSLQKLIGKDGPS